MHNSIRSAKSFPVRVPVNVKAAACNESGSRQMDHGNAK